MNKILTSKGVMDISIPAEAKMNADGEHYVICPICTPSRKPEHRKDMLLAINLKKDPMPWRCNHCGESGYIITEEYMKRAKFKPVIANFDFLELSDPLVKWFMNERKISVETLHAFRITMSIETMKQMRVTAGNEESFYPFWII